MTVGRGVFAFPSLSPIGLNMAKLNCLKALTFLLSYNLFFLLNLPASLIENFLYRHLTIKLISSFFISNNFHFFYFGQLLLVIYNCLILWVMENLEKNLDLHQRKKKNLDFQSNWVFLILEAAFY